LTQQVAADANARPSYWNDYYAGLPEEAHPAPSQFATFVLAMNKAGSIVDLGCGSGRDSLFFARYGRRVTSVDASEHAVRAIQEMIVRESAAETWRARRLDLTDPAAAVSTRPSRRTGPGSSRSGACSRSRITSASRPLTSPWSRDCGTWSIALCRHVPRSRSSARATAVVALGNRPAFHLPSDDTGAYLRYHPANGDEALAMLEQHRRRGAEYLAIPGNVTLVARHLSGAEPLPGPECDPQCSKR